MHIIDRDLSPVTLGAEAGTDARLSPKLRGGEGKALSVSPLSSPLFVLMMATNALSLAVVVPPWTLDGFLADPVRSVHVEGGYMSTARPFAPEFLRRLAIDPGSPTQAIDTALVTGGATIVLHMPGLAMECALGALQGAALGYALMRRSGSSDALPATIMLLFAGMCVSALPLHCLGGGGGGVDGVDGALHLVPDPSLSMGPADALLWVDILCTSLVPPLMLLDGLLRSRYLHEELPSLGEKIVSHRSAVVIAVASINALLVGVAVVHRLTWGPWLAMCLHIISMPFYGAPFILILALDCRRCAWCSLCSRSFLLVIASLIPIVFFSAGGVIFRTFLAGASGGAFDMMASVFLGCRIGMVHYWAYAWTRMDHCTPKAYDRKRV